MPSEFDLIQRYFARATPQTVLGPGDDCALIAPTLGMELAMTTDMLVAGTHFFPDTDPQQLGWKTLAVNVSDLAAMGARPRWALLAGSLPDADETWLASFATGFFACAAACNVDLVGGDTTRGPLSLCVTAIGEVPAGRALRRDGARPDDDLWVSGQPGLAALGLAHLQGRIALPADLARACIGQLQKPSPRVELGLALRQQALATAAIDISDGLLADLGHIAERSGVDIDVVLSNLPALPDGLAASLPADDAAELARRCQLAGGDDYELGFTAPPQARAALSELSARLGLPLWRIGRVACHAAGAGEVRLLADDGHVLPVGQRGFDHFARSPHG